MTLIDVFIFGLIHNTLQQEVRDMKVRYRREQELMSSILHNTGMKNVRQHLRAPLQTEKTSFLGIQRNKVRFFFFLVSF